MHFKKMASKSAFEIVTVLFFLCSAADASTVLQSKFFNVVNFGARADGNTDNSQVSIIRVVILELYFCI